MVLLQDCAIVNVPKKPLSGSHHNTTAGTKKVISPARPQCPCMKVAAQITAATVKWLFFNSGRNVPKYWCRLATQSGLLRGTTWLSHICPGNRRTGRRGRFPWDTDSLSVRTTTTSAQLPKQDSEKGHISTPWKHKLLEQPCARTRFFSRTWQARQGSTEPQSNYIPLFIPLPLDYTLWLSSWKSKVFLFLNKEKQSEPKEVDFWEALSEENAGIVLTCTPLPWAHRSHWGLHSIPWTQPSRLKW